MDIENYQGLSDADRKALRAQREDAMNSQCHETRPRRRLEYDPKADKPQRTQWEYDFNWPNPTTTMSEKLAGLNNKGAEGWELVTYIEDDKVGTRAVFKRPKE